LGLPIHVGALDFNLGCSGYVYGLSLAEGLIQSGAARRVLFITAETYSKYIDEADRSLRTIFGDGAAATLIEAGPEPTLSAFTFGTDGRGADTLLVTKGGWRPPEKAIQPRKRQRWRSPLYMDGPGLVSFTEESIPKLVEEVLRRANLQRDDIDLYLMHQATRFMLDRLRVRLELDETRLPMVLENCGNTVSSTIPILIDALRRDGRLKPGMRTMLVGFGVGLSWAGCIWNASHYFLSNRPSTSSR
jgi:3-oxoacyl-[acyl-carrier-protein] synthase-3